MINQQETIMIEELTEKNKYEAMSIVSIDL